MQENNQNPVETADDMANTQPVQGVPQETPMPPVAPLRPETMSSVMGATHVVNRSAPNIGLYVGIGIVTISVIIAGAYFWNSRIAPAAVEMEKVEETVVPSEVAQVDALAGEVEAAVDFSEIDATLKEIDADLSTEIQ